MRIKAWFIGLVVFGLVSVPLFAQEDHSDLSFDFTGNFQKQATGLGTTDTATGSGGLLASYRYHFNNWNAVEANYDYTKFSQFYTPGYTTQARANEFSVAYVNTLGRPAEARFRPFLEAGTGELSFSPIAAGSTTSGQRQNRVAFLYGAGVDWHAKNRFSVRLGYRGLLYNAPDFVVAVQVTRALTHMAEPYAGIVFRF